MTTKENGDYMSPEEEKLKTRFNLVQLDQDEAESIITKINGNNVVSLESIWQLRFRDAHIAYGCDSWSKFCIGHLSIIGKPKEIDRLVRTVTVEKRLGVKVGTLVPSSTRKLYSLDDATLKSVWDDAKKGCEDGKYPTAKQIEDAVGNYQQFQSMLVLLESATSKQKRLAFRAILTNASSKCIKNLRILLKGHQVEVNHAA